MLALQACVKGNVLFAHLEASELTDVLDAMFLHKAKANEIIMQQVTKDFGNICIYIYIITNKTCLNISKQVCLLYHPP